MAHWIDATEEHNKRSVKINADNITYLEEGEKGGPTQVRFVGSNQPAGKPDLLVLESPEVLLGRMEKSR